MKKEIYVAAVEGQVEFLKEARTIDEEAGVAKYSNEDLMGVTSHGNNIIHVAAKHGHLDFIKKALEGFDATQTRKLVCGTNSNGDTPLHMAAKLDTSVVAEHLVAVAPHSELWRVQNNKDNAPLHVALMNGGKSIQVAAYLLRVGPEVASYDNHRKQTPLHLAVSYNNQDAKMSTTNMVNKLNSLGASLDYMKSLFEEDSLSLIKQLLDADATICCFRDDHKMTPLLRAAQKSYLLAVEAIIKCYPECIEICDPKGKSFLHYIKFPNFSKAREFLRINGISAFIDQQDEDGNTPLHMAIMKCDYNMVKAMFECNANFAIQNNDGTSPATLIQLNSSCFLDKTKEDIRRCNMMKDEIMMPKELFEAACNRNWNYLLEMLRNPHYDVHHQLQSRLPDGSNILHLAFQRGRLEDHNHETTKELMEEAGMLFPILLCQTDFKGCTPLHSLLTSTHYFYPIVHWHWDCLKDILRQMKDQQSCYPLAPWEAKDFNGDTLLHLALRHHKIYMAELLIEIMDAKSVWETNNFNETPLHILCRYNGSIINLFIEVMEAKSICETILGRVINETPLHVNETPPHTPLHHYWRPGYCEEMAELLIEKDGWVVHMYDADGFTPLLRAVKSNALDIALKLLELCPEIIRQVDSQFGRNLLHLLPDLDPDRRDHREFIQNREIKSLMRNGDRERNMPIHLAIIEGRFGTAQILLQQDFALLLKGENNDGKTAIDLLETKQNIPRKFKKFLISVKRISEDREDKLHYFKENLYGVYYSDMKDFMGTLGVVAALLATITFTAAFTVPGGYNQDKGFPILAKQVAFQVFMVTDVIGMCSSVMALCCLIWFFTSNRIEEEGTRFGDLSMAFLQLSFYATLVAFMTGVYVTTSSKELWLAIFTCVTCSLVLLIMRKHFIMKYLGDVLYYVHDHAVKKNQNLAKKVVKKWAKRVVACLKSKNNEENNDD